MLEKKLLKFAETRIKTAGDTGSFEGFASTYANVDSYNDTVVKGAYTDTLAAGHEIAMYWNHQYRQPGMPAKIGRWTFEDTADGLLAKGQLLMAHPLVKSIWPSIAANLVDGLSIGYQVPAGGSKKNAAGIRELHKIDLKEVSIVDEPADGFARMNLDTIKSLVSIRDVEDCLRDAGFSATEAKAFISTVKATLTAETPDPDLAAIAALTKLYGKN